jgi:uncharacterized membrane protein YccC
MQTREKGLFNILTSRLFIYILEFLCASGIAYLLVLMYPQYRLVWAMTSIAFVMSPKSDESRALIYGRIKANILGAVIGFAVMLIELPTVVLLGIGIVFTIFLTRHFKLYKTVRSALVALVIIIVPAYSEPHTSVALERAVCVLIGCVIALLVTFVFDSLISKYIPYNFETKAYAKPSSDEA